MKIEIDIEILCYGLLLSVMLFIGFYPMGTNNKTNISYCHIDSVQVVSRYEFTSEPMNKYFTDCGYIFTSKNSYNINDSIKIKTIIIDEE